MGQAKQKILVVHLGNFSFINSNVCQQLEEKFPEYTVESFDVAPLFRSNPIPSLINAFYVLREYGTFKRGSRWATFSSTTYAQRMIKQWVAEHVANGGYVFTFQTQSLFDASTPNLPHFVYTDHTSLANLYYPGFDRRELRPRTFLQEESKVYDNADIVFALSTHVKKSLLELYHLDESKVFQIGIGSNIKIPDGEPQNDGYGNKNILFVGVDWVRKGGPELMKAFEIVHKEHPDATLTIVGSSPEIDHPGVRIVGRVPLEEVAQYYQRASVFSMPTRREPFGIVFLEAIYNKLPIVTTNIGAVPDLVHQGKNGYTVNTGDYEQLAKYLTELVGDPEKCRAFGEYGYNYLKDDYTWDTVGKKMREHIQPILQA